MTNIHNNHKWFAFAAGLATGVLPSFGAFTAWVWSGPSTIEEYYPSNDLHSAAVASGGDYMAFWMVIVCVITVSLGIALFKHFKTRQK